MVGGRILRSIVFVAVTGVGGLAFATAAAGGASEFIRELGKRAIATLQSPGKSLEEREAHFRGLLREGFDVRFIDRPSGPPIEAEWRVRTTENRYRIIDITVEGVSMVITQRSEFSAVIQRNGFEGLIAVLRARTSKLPVTAALN